MTYLAITRKPAARRSAQAGFTLIELAIVIVIIGVLAAVVVPKLKGGGDQAKSNALYDFAQSAAGNWRLLSMKCGTTTDVSASALPTTAGATNSLNLIVNGDSGLNTTYTGCYADTGVAPLRSKVQGTSGAFTVQGFAVTWSGGSSNGPIKFDFASLQPEIGLNLYKKLSNVAGAPSATAFPTVADNSDPVIQFSATPAGSNITNFSIIIH